MGEKCGETVSSENRSHALALMRFFSVDVDSEMNIPSASNSFPVQEISMWSKEFVFKIIQLVSINSCVKTIFKTILYQITLTCFNYYFTVFAFKLMSYEIQIRFGTVYVTLLIMSVILLMDMKSFVS